MKAFAAGLVDARWVIVFALLVFGANLGLSQMRGDAMIYAAVSKNLAENGNPLQLTLDGEPYLNKPPLYFWLTAGIMGVAGTGPVGVKLGALMASTLLCVLLYRSVRRIFDDRQAGLLSVFVFSATYVVYRMTYHARMESLVTLFILASLMCFLRWLEGSGPRWILGWGLLAGLAVLTKGPVGVLPLLAGLAYLLLAERSRLRASAWVHLVSGLLVFALSCGWWFALSGDAFLEHYFRSEILERSILGDTQATHRWWSVYWAKLLSYDLIWLVTAGIGVHRAWVQPGLRRPVGLLLSAALVHLVLIHLVEEKSAHYLYQLYIFTAGLSAVGILALRRFDAERLLKIVIVVFALGLQVTGTRGGRDHFGPLPQAVALSKSSGWPLVADARDFGHLDERAALDYYLDETRPPAILPGTFILVRPKSEPMTQARPLFVSDRLWIGLVIGDLSGPGPVEPMHSATEGSS